MEHRLQGAQGALTAALLHEGGGEGGSEGVHALLTQEVDAIKAALMALGPRQAPPQAPAPLQAQAPLVAPFYHHEAQLASHTLISATTNLASTLTVLGAADQDSRELAVLLHKAAGKVAANLDSTLSGSGAAATAALEGRGGVLSSRVYDIPREHLHQSKVVKIATRGDHYGRFKLVYLGVQILVPQDENAPDGPHDTISVPPLSSLHLNEPGGPGTAWKKPLSKGDLTFVYETKVCCYAVLLKLKELVEEEEGHANFSRELNEAVQSDRFWEGIHAQRIAAFVSTPPGRELLLAAIATVTDSVVALKDKYVTDECTEGKWPGAGRGDTVKRGREARREEEGEKKKK